MIRPISMQSFKTIVAENQFLRRGIIEPHATAKYSWILLKVKVKKRIPRFTIGLNYVR